MSTKVKRSDFRATFNCGDLAEGAKEDVAPWEFTGE